MSSVPYIMEKTTLSVIKGMARDRQFVAQEKDSVRTPTEDHVIIRDTTHDRSEDSGKGEQNILKPAFIITYMGTGLPPQAGQNCEDDSRNQLLIQLVDDVPPTNTNRTASYYKWMSQIRKKLQLNPYRAELLPSVADIFLVHVNQISKASPRDYRLHGQMRAGLEVTVYAREPRT